MFEIGVIVKPQGLRGELRIFPTTDDPSRFGLLEEVFVRGKDGALVKYAISSARLQKGMAVLALAGVGDRGAAEALVGSVLVIPDEWALPLDTDEYFVRDLIGCVALEEDGTVLGEIADVFPTGANDVYVVRPTSGDAFMVPAVKEVVRAVDISARRVTLRLMDGLRGLKA